VCSVSHQLTEWDTEVHYSEVLDTQRDVRVEGVLKNMKTLRIRMEKKRSVTQFAKWGGTRAERDGSCPGGRR